MAKKKPSLVEAVKKLPAQKSGQRPWIETLSPEHRKTFLEVVAHIKSLSHYERPNQDEVIALLQSEGIQIGIRTYRKFIAGR